MKTSLFKLLLLLLISLFGTSIVYSQSSNGIDYSMKSNVINPDTLSGDFKKIFWHYLDLKSVALLEKTPQKLKEEFLHFGIKEEEEERFLAAYIFYAITLESHKEDCEMWEEFKHLAPKKKE